MKKAPDQKNHSEMREEYDFSRGQRGKYARRYSLGTNVVVLNPDVRKSISHRRNCERLIARARRNHSQKPKEHGDKIGMIEVIFEVREDEVDGGFSASALGLGIHTEGETVEELRANVREAVNCYFDEAADAPRVIRLHFVRDEVLAR